jgi:maltose alpha-D-glucosyltransferase/alpha-amylase
MDAGLNPDLEISRFLTMRHFEHVAPLAGALEYQSGRGEPATLGLLQGYVPNHGDAWRFSLDFLGRFFEDVLAQPVQGDGVPWMPSDQHQLEYVGAELPPEVKGLIGTYLDSAQLLGQRTAELHLALASEADDPAFAPERLTRLKQRALYQSMRSSARLSFQMLRKASRTMPEELSELAHQVAGLEEGILDRFRLLASHKIDACLIRCHGDYHLGQVLNTGKDFVIIDFEGEPARPLTERRLKRSPLRDVAGMIRSFHYAGYAALFNREMGGVRAEDQQALEPWARYWAEWSTVAFLKGYLEAAEGAVFLPSPQEDLALMLDAFRLDKAMYEMRYELDNRPNWLRIPLKGVLDMMNNIDQQ